MGIERNGKVYELTELEMLDIYLKYTNELYMQSVKSKADRLLNKLKPVVLKNEVQRPMAQVAPDTCKGICVQVVIME